jgi:hypothetical protein
VQIFNGAVEFGWVVLKETQTLVAFLAQPTTHFVSGVIMVYD